MQVKDHTGAVIGSCFDGKPGQCGLYLTVGDEQYPLMHHTNITQGGVVTKWSLVRLKPGQDPQHLPGYEPVACLTS